MLSAYFIHALPWLHTHNQARPRSRFALAAIITMLIAEPSLTWAANEGDPPHLPADLTEFSLEELVNIEVTSVSKKGQPLSHSAAAIFVISQDDIRRSGVTSIPEALRMVPGLNVAKLDGNKWAITARGLNDRYANKLLVLIDGRTVYSPVFAGTYWELQDYVLEDIDRIEVIRGPGGSLWGANAVNGIINVVTKKAKDTQGLLASTVAGPEEGIGTVRYGGKVGADLHYRAYGKYFNRDTTYNSPAGAHDDWRNGRGGLRADWTASSRDDVTVQGDYSDAQIGQRQTLATLTSPFSRTVDEDGSLSSHNLLTRWTHRLEGGSETALQLYYDSYRRDTVSLGERVQTYDVDFQHRFVLPLRQEIVWGLGYRLTSDRFRNSANTIVLKDARDISLYSAFLQDEIKLIPDRLSLTLGSKLLHNDYTGFEIQPSARLLWQATKAHTFWTAVSRAVRTPDRFRENSTLNVAGTGAGFVKVQGNDQLQSEAVMAYELGYRTTPFEQLSLDIATFYTHYDHLTYSTTVNSLTSRYANNASARTSGVEVAADWRPVDWWSLRPALTYFQATMEGATPQTAGTTARAGSTPERQLSLRSRINMSHGMEFDAWLRYMDRLRDMSVPSYTTLDLRLGWHATKNLTLDLVGQNLLDPHHPEFSTRAGGTQLTEVQRSAFIRLTWQY